jgi:hypothetical protein
MSKEKDMINPNHLGHFHRDIVKIIGNEPYYYWVKMSCGHIKLMSKAAYKKYKDHATFCFKCKK